LNFDGIIMPMEEEQKEEVFQTPSRFESNIRRGNSPIKRVLIIVISIVVLGLIIFGVMRFLGGSEDSQVAEAIPTPTIEEIPTEEPTPPEEEDTPTPTDKPEATPKPSVNPVDKASGLDRSKLSVHILNGSGVTGAAKKASDFLEGLGYNVIQIGNAENSDYEKTVIQIRSAKDDYLPLLKKDLSSNYSVGSTSADLVSSERADSIVIIGEQ
jgi:hypothetical protein